MAARQRWQVSGQKMQSRIEEIDMVLATRSSANHLAALPQLRKAYGHLTLLPAQVRSSS
jgi:hypothetical protein